MRQGINVKLNKLLRKLTEKEAIVLGARASLRALPYAYREGSSLNQARLLAVCRGAISFAPGMFSVSSEARMAARSAAINLAGLSRAPNQLGAEEREAVAAANSVARAASVYKGRIDAQKEVADASADSIRAYTRISETFEQFHLSDMSYLGKSISADEVFDIGLFADDPQSQNPKAWISLQKYFATAPDIWGFWNDWYSGYVDGEPMDWELQRQVALLPEEVWLQGAPMVANKIEELRTRGSLLSAIEDTEAELQLASASRHGIGGNNPPEAISVAHSLVADEFTIAWQPLQDLKHELAAETPDTTIIENAVEALKSFLSAGIKWLASKGDLAVDSAIRWAIPAVGGGYLALNPDKIQVVIQQAEHLLSFLH